MNPDTLLNQAKAMSAQTSKQGATPFFNTQNQQTPAPVNNTPILTQTPPPQKIDANQITNTPNLQTTKVNQVTDPNAFVGSLNQFIGNTAGNPVSAEQTQSDLMKRQSEAYQQLGGQGQAQQQLESNLGVPQYIQQIQDLNTSIAQKTAQYQKMEQNALYSGNTTDFGQGAYGIAQRTAAIDLGAQAALLQAYQGNLQTSLNYAQHAIDLQYKPILTAIDATKAQLEANQSLMTAQQASRAQSLNAALTLQQQAVTQAATDKQNIFSVALQAAQSGAPTTIASAISKASSPTEATAIYSKFLSGDTNPVQSVQYQTSTQTPAVRNNNPGNIKDPNTGQFMQFTSPEAGLLALQHDLYQKMTGATSTGLTGNSSIADFAKKYAPSSDGNDPVQYAKNLAAQLGVSTSAKIGDFKDGDKLKQFALAISKNEDINMYSQLTDKQPATVETQKQNFTDLQKSAPPFIAKSLQQSTATGATYIDLSKVDSNYSSAVSAWAKTHGNIPQLTANQVSDVQNTDEAIRNIKEVIAPAWESIAPGSNLGRVGNLLVYPGSFTFNTDYYSNKKTFESNRENLAQQISALSKSAPKLGLLGTAESALPDAALVGGDTYKDGINKLNRTLDLLNQSIRTYIPNATPVTLQNAQNTQPASTEGKTSSGVGYKVIQ